MSLLIRPVQPADIPLLKSLICELAEYEHLSHKVAMTEELLQENLFQRKYAEALIAEYEQTPAGYALFFHNFSTFQGRPGLYLEDLYVRPEFRARGIGRALLQRLAALASERKCCRMEWTCLNWNAPSIKFYKSLGAVPKDEWSIYRLDGAALQALAAGNLAK
ncbi:MAG: GNAT family N-acetyltransferase [Lentisphaerae bacterium]|nr:GNAT family N-acetyltransferase [Lentisphaerota bacterium]